MDDLAVWISGWDSVGNKCLAAQLIDWGIPHVFTHCDKTKHEPENYNFCIGRSISLGFKYIEFLDSDVSVLHRETIPKLYEVITTRDRAGSVRPWRFGEAMLASAALEEKYVDDNTAMMFRLDMGLWFDEELLFTGWSDVDAGSEIEYLGYKNFSDRRYPVHHDMSRSCAHSQSTFLEAMKKRNKLIVDYKWWKCGRKDWHGVESYNATLPVDERIPSMNEIAAASDEKQRLFADSVHPEHGQIFLKDGEIHPNPHWKNPWIVGYNFREQWKERHGY